MSDTLPQLLSQASALVNELGLTREDAYAVSVRSGITFQMEPLPLLRVMGQLKVPPMDIKVYPHQSQGTTSIHTQFTARGAVWVAVIAECQLVEFYTTLGSLFAVFKKSKRAAMQATAI